LRIKEQETHLTLHELDDDDDDDDSFFYRAIVETRPRPPYCGGF
jgi:hypothetical protein